MASNLDHTSHFGLIVILFAMITLISISCIIYHKQISLKDLQLKCILFVFGDRPETSLQLYEYKKLHVENIEDGYQFEHVNSSEEDINMIFDVDIEDDITMEVSKHSRKQNRRKVISPKNARHLYRVHHNQSYTDHITHLENDPEEKIEEVKSSIEQLALQMAKQITYSLYSNTDRTVTNTEESSEDYFSNIVYNGDSVSYEYSHNGSQSFGESSQNA